ncbi:C-type mannose receptor 2-like [Cyprinus carpio]|uniref:C-type mannose receptor 2-like n=1 Tax=Cyprinus carpio TaxID=7962 RepID=A0A9Q9Y7N7_CYPCA|nr:C-type mannose receptor 2-like [Cyprinus carpio]
MKIFWVALFLSAHCELTLTLNRKHIFINNAKTWSDAQKFCRENYADLSIIDSQVELLRFKNDSKNQRADSTQSWIGLSKPSANGTWVWNDGSDEISMTWRIGQPDSPNTAFCGKSLGGELYDYDCAIFCYKWVPELILVMEKKSWEEALEHCRTQYSGLASLSTSLLHFRANNETVDLQTPSVWTGVRFLAGSWFWVNGESLGNLDQLPECPARPLYCGSQNLAAKSWENRDCSEKLNFVCYKRSG